MTHSNEVWTSSYAPVEAGDSTFHELIAAVAARQPDRVAIDGLTYGELAGRIERVAALLAARGFGPGDVLAIRAPNMAPWAGVALAAMTAGGAVTGIGPSATDEEVRRQLADSGASLLIDRFDDSLLEATGPAARPHVAPATWRCCRIRAAPAGCPRAWCSRTPTS